MKIIFRGAAQTVTGSQHEVILGEKRLLLDCGMFQGPRQMARQINSTFDYDPKTLSAVILSHGHQDHCGNLPSLVKRGFNGPIYATPATAAIAALMLMDSAKIQEEDAAYLNQKTVKTWQGQIEPLYTVADVQRTIPLFRSLPYRQPLRIDGATIEFRDAGHILGSALVRVTETGRNKTLVFTGDVGRPNAPILEDPDPFSTANAVITESTYGGRQHAPVEKMPQVLAQIIQWTAKRGGWLIIPAFALGRTQSVIHQIAYLREHGMIPGNVPVYVDSPLANAVTDVFRHNENLWDEETREMLRPFNFPHLTYVRSSEESRRLNSRRGPGIIIAASGMCESGRVLHHLKHHLREPESTVLIAGYQAQHTLGRKLAEGMREVPILGDWIPVRATVEKIDGLSAHADGVELVGFLKPLLAQQPHIFLVHGEPEATVAQEAALRAVGFRNVSIPQRNEEYEL